MMTAEFDVDLPNLQWSGSFAVLPRGTARNLQGDKIVLPQSALEQLLNAAPVTPLAGANFTSRDPFNSYSNHIRSNGLNETRQLPSPLTFRLVNAVNNRVVFAGIREFSCPEGTIGISPFLQEALGVDLPEKQEETPNEDGSDPEDVMDLPQITVHAKQLPKGTYVRLRPLEAGYDPDDWKSLLERQLRNGFTSMTLNTTLTVRGVGGEEFQFLVDKFAPEGDAICVVDTDLEVDIEALDEEQARETMRRIYAKQQRAPTAGSSSGGELDIWKPQDGQVAAGDYVDYILPSWDRSRPLSVELNTTRDGDECPDMYITPKSSQQRTKPRESEYVFDSYLMGPSQKKTIVISPTNVELEGAESLMISVHAYTSSDDPPELAAESIPFTIRAHAVVEDPFTQHESIEDHAAGDEQCRNCLQWIPKQTMMLHENFCRRNNLRCPHCPTVFKKGSPEWEDHWHCELDEARGNSPRSKARHNQVFHGHHQCPGCAFATNSLRDLARHRTSLCPAKIILCRFCHLEVPQEGDPFNPSPEVVLSGMTAHELADGTRTTECHLCDKIVRLRDMETHLKHHELDKVSRQAPAICRNALCGRTLHGVGPKGQVGQGQGPGNVIGLCSLCYGPLYVSMHDPEGKALRRRIERRYLSQVMTGCGKSHCGNEWCRTGRSNLGLEPKETSTKVVLPLVKPLLTAVTNSDEPMYFCVDESNQGRRHRAEVLAAEHIWDLPWCIAAAEAENGNPEKMREWLQAWAPSRV